MAGDCNLQLQRVAQQFPQSATKSFQICQDFIPNWSVIETAPLSSGTIRNGSNRHSSRAAIESIEQMQNWAARHVEPKIDMIDWMKLGWVAGGADYKRISYLA